MFNASSIDEITNPLDFKSSEILTLMFVPIWIIQFVFSSSVNLFLRKSGNAESELGERETCSGSNFLASVYLLYNGETSRGNSW